jgi:hypothetical protein
MGTLWCYEQGICKDLSFSVYSFCRPQSQRLGRRGSFRRPYRHLPATRFNSCSSLTRACSGCSSPTSIYSSGARANGRRIGTRPGGTRSGISSKSDSSEDSGIWSPTIKLGRSKVRRASKVGPDHFGLVQSAGHAPRIQRSNQPQAALGDPRCNITPPARSFRA